MDLHLDRLLNLPDVTVESCIQEAPKVFLKLRFLREDSNCPHCDHSSAQLNQNRPVLIRDLSIFGQPVYLQVPRRQFYCRNCQKYFTESLSFVDWERRYTQRYENYIYQRVQATTRRASHPTGRRFVGIRYRGFSIIGLINQKSRLGNG